LSLKPIAEKLRYFGIDTHYFDMHLAIDNASEGHGKIAVDAIKLYMSNITALTGERGAQSVWRRIWDGFAAFSIMQDYLGDSVTAGLAATADVEAQVVDLIAAKKEYGALNHHGHVLGGWRINDLFNEPHLFLGKLADSKFIVKGKPDESPFFRLLQPDGCMFGVFSSDEIALLEKWVRSLEGRASVGVSDQRIEPEIPVLPFHPRQPAIAPAEYLS